MEISELVASEYIRYCKPQESEGKSVKELLAVRDTVDVTTPEAKAFIAGFLVGRNRMKKVVAEILEGYRQSKASA